MSLKGSSRNAPCPCGSGKKYKKCCLLVEQNDTSKLLWQKLRQTDDQLVAKLLQFADLHFGEDIVSEGWEDFSNARKNLIFEMESVHNQAFIPWFLYNWNVGLRMLDNWETGPITIASEYLATYHKKIADMERRFITLNTLTPFTFYEIIDCDQGSGYTLKDILSGNTLYVTEKSGSQKTQPGDIIFAKAIQYDDIAILCGSGAVIIPPLYKPQIIDFRAGMRLENDMIGQEEIYDRDDDLRELYWEIYEQLHRPPEICNTEGDPLLFHEVIYRIESAQTTFDALKRLAAGIPELELLETAEFDDQNHLINIEFPWLKTARKTSVGLEMTTLGQIFITKNELKVLVNSEKRANRIKKEIKKRLDKGAKFLSMEVNTLDKLRDKFNLDEDQRPEPAPTPEMQEVRNRILESHWKNWVDDHIPALGGLTPRQAVKDEDGREKVLALLNDFERHEKEAPETESQLEYIKKVRKQLGLTRKAE
jgi:hypothetical protein